jgi:hypothetical protein
VVTGPEFGGGDAQEVVFDRCVGLWCPAQTGECGFQWQVVSLHLVADSACRYLGVAAPVLQAHPHSEGVVRCTGAEGAAVLWFFGDGLFGAPAQGETPPEGGGCTPCSGVDRPVVQGLGFTESGDRYGEVGFCGAFFRAWAKVIPDLVMRL